MKNRGYYEENFYSTRARFPWFIVVCLLLVAAVLGGVTTYYLFNGGDRSPVLAGQVQPQQLVVSPAALKELINETPELLSTLIFNDVSAIYAEVHESVVGIASIAEVNNRYANTVSEVEIGTGSGVIYTADGYIITNNHVVEGAMRLVVSLADGRQVEGTLIGTDSIVDLAVIKIDLSGLSAARFGDSDSLRVGELAIAIGNPGGMSFARSCTQGCISGLNRLVQTAEGQQFRLIQTDAAINPGNSGGALVNSSGEVIGINTIKITSVTYEGMGFALPCNTVVAIADEIIKNGKVTRPALGVSILRDIDASFAEYNELTVNYGVLVNPLEGSAAEKAGIKPYDIILAIAGEKILSGGQLQENIFARSIGDTVRVTVYREGKQLELNVILGEL